MRLAQREDPRVDHVYLVVLSVPPEGTRCRPRLDDQVMGLLEAIAVVGRIAVVAAIRSGPPPSDHAGEDRPARHEVEHGDFLRELDGVFPER